VSGLHFVFPYTSSCTSSVIFVLTCLPIHRVPEARAPKPHSANFPRALQPDLPSPNTIRCEKGMRPRRMIEKISPPHTQHFTFY